MRSFLLTILSGVLLLALAPAPAESGWGADCLPTVAGSAYGVPFHARPVPPAAMLFEPIYEWRMAGEEYTLFRNGAQIGNYLPSENGYFVRLGPGHWESEPSEPPVPLPEGAKARIEEALKKRCKCSDGCKCGRKCTCTKDKKCNKDCTCGVKVIGESDKPAVPDQVYIGTLHSSLTNPMTPDCVIWLRTGRANKEYHLVLTPEQRAAVAPLILTGDVVEIVGVRVPGHWYVERVEVHGWRAVSKAEQLPLPTENHGVDTEKISPTERITINGREVTMADAEQAIEGPMDATLPDDSAKLSLTIIGSEADRKRALADLAAPLLATFREHVLVQDYAPDSPMVAKFGFVTTGKPTIYLQKPDGTVLARVDKYDGPQTWEAVRKMDPTYQPDKDPDPTKPTPQPSPGPSPNSGGTEVPVLWLVVGGVVLVLGFGLVSVLGLLIVVVFTKK